MVLRELLTSVMLQIERHQKFEDRLKSSTQYNIIKDKNDEVQLKVFDERNIKYLNCLFSVDSSSGQFTYLGCVCWEDVVVVTLVSCPRPLKYIKPFCHVITVDSRLDFSGKKIA